MEYGVLAVDTGIATLLEHTKSIVGIGYVVNSIKNAAEWLTKNPNGNLIISMPLDQETRLTISSILGEFDTRCIAIDPPILLSGSQSVFSRTTVATTSILGQIKRITQEKVID